MTDSPDAADIAEIDRLAASTYVALTTYRKDGTAVPTPVWVSRDGDTLYVWTQADSGKVKRIRNRGHVMVAPSDARGVPQGAAVDASARVLDDPAEIARVEAAHRAKYGVQFRLFHLAGRVLRRGRGYAGIAITIV
jgi:PPOX class probable F420-dependent enzyme